MTPDNIFMLIVFGSGTAVVTVIALAVVAVVNGGRRGELSAEESQMMQEIYHGLTEFERRLEALETLLPDKDRKRS